MLRLLFFLSCLFLLASCGPNYVYEKAYELPNAQWTYADTLDFEFEIEDTSRIFNLWVTIDHSTSYSYQNLYTRVHTQFPGGERITELLSLELANSLGLWQGDCNSESCQIQIPIQEGAYFNAEGKYQITLEQFMRRDSLPGIKAVQFQLEATSNTRS